MRWSAFVPTAAERHVFVPMFRAALQGTRAGVMGGIVLAACLSWLFRASLGGPAYAAWLASFGVLVALRLATLRAYARMDDAALGPRQAFVTTALFVAVGAVWGLAGFAFPVHAAPWAPYAVLTSQLLLVVMAVPGLSWYWPCFAAFATPVLVLAPWPWVGIQHDVATVVAVGAIFNLGALGAFAARHAAVQIETLRLREQRAKLVEELQDKSDALARNLAAKSRFLAAASHDLRQPLHAMALTLDRARTQAGGLDAQGRRSLAAMVESADELLQCLVEAARADDPDGIWPLQECAVQPIVDLVADEQAQHAAARGLLLRVRHAGWAVRSNPVALQRIVRNLLSNAIKYTQRGGVLVALRRRGGRIGLEVWDTGPGIAAAQQEAVFGAYRRAASPMESAAGTGLGLAVVRQLCAALGHEVQLRSREGRGSVFRVDLGEPVAAVDPRPDLDVHVLLVARDPSLARQVEVLLRLWGCAWQKVDRPRDAPGHVERTAVVPLIERAALDDAQAQEWQQWLRAHEGRGLWLGEAEAPFAGDGSVRIACLPLPLEPVRLRAALNRLAAASRPGDAAARSPANAS